MRKTSGQPAAAAATAAHPPGTAGGTVRLTGAVAVTLGVASACWVVSVRLMTGMGMGVATRLGSFAFFAAVWMAMMAAMMLPGAAPAVARVPTVDPPPRRIRQPVTRVGGGS